MTLVAVAVIAAAAGLAAKNAEVWEKEAKATKVKALDKAVWDLSAEDMEKLVAVIEVAEGNTVLGTIKFKFQPRQAPTHCKNFILLAEKGFYNGVIFHRVIKGFMIQGGDPKGTGTGGPGWAINAEFSDLPHNKGTVSMARTNDPNSAGSQFFICLEKSPFLDRNYSVFGQVIEGQEVVDKIGGTRTDSNDRPVKDQVMKKVSIEKLPEKGK
jgi:peptidyl-prolyl cis-trans isomerase B (cyclophilin B)